MQVFSDVRRKPRVQTVNDMPSRTVQSDRNRSEVKFILQQYQATGYMLGLREVDLQFRDVSEFEDFADVMRQGKEAEAAFMRLPAKVRGVFGHDVSEWLDAAHDGLSNDQVRKLEALGVLEVVEKPAEAPAEPAPASE